LENANGGAGVYSVKMTKHYMLSDDDWKDDIIPEIMEGHNIADFVDADILARLDELEREEEAREASAVDDEEMSEEDLNAEEHQALAAIRMKKRKLLEEHRRKKRAADNNPVMPRKHDRDGEFTTGRIGRHLTSLGLDPSAAIERVRSRSVSRRGRKRERSVSEGGDAMDIDQPNKRLKSRSRSRSTVRPIEEVLPGSGFKDSAQKMKAVKIGKNAVKQRNKDARRGEADRVVYNPKPKHLFSGKRGTGKTDRR
jgi:nucleolar GTP-binding protein